MPVKVITLVDAEWFCRGVGDNISPKVKYPPPDVIYHNIVTICAQDEDLVKILYYESTPFTKTLENPISQTNTDYSQSASASARNRFLEQIVRKEKVALRRGHVLFRDWKLRTEYVKNLMGGNVVPPKENDLQPDFLQKGVDMKIGLDMASIAYKKQADRIILLTGDTDMVPAMKLVRTEGIQVVVVRIGKWKLSNALIEHSDFDRHHTPVIP